MGSTTAGSTEPVPLSELACSTLLAWKKEQGSKIPFVFPSPRFPDRPISTVKTILDGHAQEGRRTALSDLQPAACLLHSLERIASDAVVQRAMRHTSPETKRRYQLGMADQVREAVEKSNKTAYGRRRCTTFLRRFGRENEEGAKRPSVTN